VAAIVSLAVVVGFLAGMAVITVLGVVLPPFREEVDDDTVRQFVPVALAYATWATTSLAFLLLTLHRFRREDPNSQRRGTT
jgi:MFS superfamily sulfate permease-like transporter